MTSIMQTKLDDWPDGWLKMEIAALVESRHAFFLLMHDAEKRKHSLPVTRDEMIAYVRERELHL